MHNKIFVFSKQCLGIQTLQAEVQNYQFSMVENMTNDCTYCAFPYNFSLSIYFALNHTLSFIRQMLKVLALELKESDF